MNDNHFICSGQLALHKDGKDLSTILGSCIAVCIYDQRLQAGGMNHFLLPSKAYAGTASAMKDFEFGDLSTIELIRRFKMLGSKPGDLVATIVGGARLDKASPLVGDLNFEIAEQVLRNYGIAVKSRCVGGVYSRKILFKTKTGEVLVQKQLLTNNETTSVKSLICIGASTGGTEVLRHILSRLTPPCPPVLIVQHMPDHFTGMFAESLNSQSSLKVMEVKDGTLVQNNHVYLARGGLHMGVAEKDDKIYLRTNDDPPINLFKPSVDYLFYSVMTRKIAPKSLAILLTGMGDDGAYGLKALRNKGCKTFVQNESSCIVYGMPKVAMEIGAAQKSLSPDEIIRQIQVFINESQKAA